MGYIEGFQAAVKQKWQQRRESPVHDEPTCGIVMNKPDEMKEAQKAVCIKKSSSSAWTGLKGFNNWEHWEEKLQKNVFKQHLR